MTDKPQDHRVSPRLAPSHDRHTEPPALFLVSHTSFLPGPFIYIFCFHISFLSLTNAENERESEGGREEGGERGRGREGEGEGALTLSRKPVKEESETSPW